MTLTATLLFIALFLLTDFIVVGAVMHMAAQTWRELAAPFPPKTPLATAVRRDFQSFKVNMINLGMCVHVAVDDQHLHLFPALFPRALMKAAPCSIPWSAITLRPNQKRTRANLTARIGKLDITGPRWCLELAQPE